MLKRISDCKHSGVHALVFCGFLLLSSSGFAAPNGEPDVPNLQAAPEPHTSADQIKLAGNYLFGRGVAQDFKRSAYWYEKAAEGGDPKAQMQTGYLYDAGIGVAKDPARAAHWYQLAAANGLPSAEVNLGILYFWGNGMNMDRQLAVQLFREAAAKGNGRAAYYLGNLYYQGVSVPQDKATAELWFVRGAELHDPQAEYNLGLLYFDQPDHAHDLNQAAGLLRESVTAGYVPAMFSLGLLLERKPELARSTDEAFTLLSESANAGIWKSSMILGVLARDGKGVPVDDCTAYLHFRAAALQGGNEASNLLEKDLHVLAAQLGPDQAAKLDTQAENWQRGHHTVFRFVYKKGDNRAGFPSYALAAPENGAHAVQMLPAMPD